MTSDEVLAARERLRVAAVKHRAALNVSTYRAVRRLLWMTQSFPQSTLIEEAYSIKRSSRGINLKRFRLLVEAITGEKICW